MSNNSGSRMVNNILEKLKEHYVFNILGKVESYKVVKEITDIACDYDCNQDQVLEGIAGHIGICSCCLKPKKVYKSDMCKKCYTENCMED